MERALVLDTLLKILAKVQHLKSRILPVHYLEGFAVAKQETMALSEALRKEPLHSMPGNIIFPGEEVSEPYELWVQNPTIELQPKSTWPYFFVRSLSSASIILPTLRRSGIAQPRLFMLSGTIQSAHWFLNQLILKRFCPWKNWIFISISAALSPINRLAMRIAARATRRTTALIYLHTYPSVAFAP